MKFVPYDPFWLSKNLKPGVIEIVVEQYVAGRVSRIGETLIRKAHLSNDDKASLLRALVCTYAGMSLESIVSAHRNKRGRKKAVSPLRIHVTHPEPGVLRRYCGADTVAWMDEVVSEDHFRAMQERLQ